MAVKTSKVSTRKQTLKGAKSVKAAPRKRIKVAQSYSDSMAQTYEAPDSPRQPDPTVKAPRVKRVKVAPPAPIVETPTAPINIFKRINPSDAKKRFEKGKPIVIANKNVDVMMQRCVIDPANCPDTSWGMLISEYQSYNDPDDGPIVYFAP